MTRALNIAGRTFGKLTVLQKAEKRGRHTMWLCRCECGAQSIAQTSNLTRRHTTSCGCSKGRVWNLPNLTGKRFGRLVVLNLTRVHRSGSLTRAWRCQCDCGKTCICSATNLTQATVVSCGCYNREIITRHGLSGTKIHRAWVSMRSRCSDPKVPGYKDYGGRGIKVCERWSSFELFMQDMGIPEPGMQIDRIDNDGNYDPGNCRWADVKQQSENRRSTRVFAHEGQSLTIPAWARKVGISKNVLYKRLMEFDWPIEKALTTPTARRAQRRA